MDPLPSHAPADNPDTHAARREFREERSRTGAGGVLQELNGAKSAKLIRQHFGRIEALKVLRQTKLGLAGLRFRSAGAYHGDTDTAKLVKFGGRVFAR